MWWSKRQIVLGACAAAAFAASACSFTPVYGPGTAATKLQDRIAITEPTTRAGYLVTRRLESRLGRADPAPMTLTLTPTYGAAGLGTTATGGTTRLHQNGGLTYALTNTDTGANIDGGYLTAFTGYSATGNTAATLAAERDSIDRLMILLADQLMDRLLLLDPALLP